MYNEYFEDDIDTLLRKLASEKRFVDIGLIEKYSNKIEKCKNDPEALERLEYIFNELLTNQDSCNQVISDILSVNNNTPDYLIEPRIRVLSDNDIDIQDFINIKNNQILLDKNKGKK